MSSLTAKKLLILPASCAVVRFMLFAILHATQSYDAQWQLEYWPLWVIDFPISLAYILARLPVPAAEAVIGPIWWFIMPLGILSFARTRKQRRAEKRKTVSG
jgi:hypothetical protein